MGEKPDEDELSDSQSNATSDEESSDSDSDADCSEDESKDESSESRQGKELKTHIPSVIHSDYATVNVQRIQRLQMVLYNLKPLKGLHDMETIRMKIADQAEFNPLEMNQVYSFKPPFCEPAPSSVSDPDFPRFFKRMVLMTQKMHKNERDNAKKGNPPLYPPKKNSWKTRIKAIERKFALKESRSTNVSRVIGKEKSGRKSRRRF